jgi:LuxR family transcriptional regulator, quorum-sensing system regulator BjaR1
MPRSGHRQLTCNWTGCQLHTTSWCNPINCLVVWGTQRNGAVEFDEYGACALDFVDRLSGLNNREDVFAAFTHVIGRFGFDYATIAELPSQALNTPLHIHLAHVPSEFFELYLSQGFLDCDPVVRHALRTETPFEWHEAPYDPQHEPRAREVMERRKDYGLNFGFAIPLPSVQSASAGIGLGSRDKPDLNRRSKPALHLMAIYTLTRIRQLQLASTAKAEPLALLSDREREILILSAAGKSAGEIADVLGITKRTIDFHITAAMRKLGASNKTHAVALALAQRLIQL